MFVTIFYHISYRISSILQDFPVKNLKYLENNFKFAKTRTKFVEQKAKKQEKDVNRLMFMR